MGNHERHALRCEKEEEKEDRQKRQRKKESSAAGRWKMKDGRGTGSKLRPLTVEWEHESNWGER